MVEINATEAARSFGEIIDRCLQGETFLVCRRGRPLVEIKVTRSQGVPLDDDEKDSDRAEA